MGAIYKARLERIISSVVEGCDSFAEAERAFRGTLEMELFVHPRLNGTVVGVKVEVVDLRYDDEEAVIVATCRRKGKEYPVPATAVELAPRVRGREYWYAYREFHRLGVL